MKPRHAIAYHSWIWHDIHDETFAAVREVIASEKVQPTGTSDAYRAADKEPPEVSVDWISDDINAGKWDGYSPPPLPKE